MGQYSFLASLCWVLELQTTLIFSKLRAKTLDFFAYQNMLRLLFLVLLVAG
jgi:hypothetical protein